MNPKTKNVLRALFLFALWVASGIWANLYWHFKENSRLQGRELGYLVTSGVVFGPGNWIAGYLTSYEFRHKTLIEKSRAADAHYTNAYYQGPQTLTPFAYGSSLASPSTNPPVYYWTGTNAGFHFITISDEYPPYVRPYPWQKDLTTNLVEATGPPLGTNSYGIPWFKRGTNAFGLIGPTNLAPSNAAWPTINDIAWTFNAGDKTVPHRIGYTYDGNIVLALSNRLHVHWDYPGFQFFLVPATEQEIAALTNLFRTNLNRRTLLFTD